MSPATLFSRVRNGLPAGGRWIRTIGPCREEVGFRCGRRLRGWKGATHREVWTFASLGKSARQEILGPRHSRSGEEPLRRLRQLENLPESPSAEGGYHGMGEGGTIGAPTAIANARFRCAHAHPIEIGLSFFDALRGAPRHGNASVFCSCRQPCQYLTFVSCYSNRFRR
jgi:hypothetical protein